MKKCQIFRKLKIINQKMNCDLNDLITKYGIIIPSSNC